MIKVKDVYSKKAKQYGNYFDYFFLCLFLRSLFFRLWVAILCFFLFFPLGIYDLKFLLQTG